MSTALIGQLFVGFAMNCRIVFLFRTLFGFMIVGHLLLCIGAQSASIAGFVIARMFAMRPFIVRAGLICGVIVSHNFMMILLSNLLVDNIRTL
jgi:hypothetical protein